MTNYERRIKSRGWLHFVLGLFPRLRFYIQYSTARFWARRKKASVGKYSLISFRLAKKSNANLCIGAFTSIDTDDLDLRNKVQIGNHVIIGNKSRILTTSHNIHSVEWNRKDYGIQIEDYVWIAENVIILPSCRKIGYGAVIGTGSVVVKDVPPMSVYAGNPAIKINDRGAVHSNIVVESLRGGDFVKYIKTYFSHK